MKKLFFVSLILMWLPSCSSSSTGSSGSSSGDSSSSGGTSSGSTSTGLSVKAAADFTKSAAALKVPLKETGTCNQDTPDEAAGADCDGDGGIVTFVTPSKYSLAIKSASLLRDDGGTLALISGKAKLTDSEVINFTSANNSETVVDLSPSDLTQGNYTGIKVEVYYFQMTFPVNGESRNVRIYMSDDDFPAEGGLGHHQGDITFVDDVGNQAWIDSTWLNQGVTTTRGAGQNGAGGKDAETGHDRGFFGNAEFWNAADLNQGAGQDIFVTTYDFPATLTIPDPATITSLTTVTITFSTADTFFFEDFPPTGTGFSPGPGMEASAESTAWAPLAPTATLTVE